MTQFSKNVIMFVKGINKALLVFVASCLLSACNEKIDGSSEAAYTASLERMAKGKTDEEKKELLKDMVVIAFHYEDAAEMRRAIHGKDRQQVKDFAEHIRELTRIKKETEAKKREEEARERERQRIEEEQRQEKIECEQRLNALKPELVNALAELCKCLEDTANLRLIEIHKSGFIQEKVEAIGIPSYYQPAIELAIENKSEESISGIAFRAKLFEPGRPVSMVDEKVGYRIQGGVNPKEAKEVQIGLNRFSEWGQLEKRIYLIDVELLGVYGTDGGILWMRDDEAYRSSVDKFWQCYDKLSEITKKLKGETDGVLSICSDLGISSNLFPAILQLAIDGGREEEVAACAKSVELINAKLPSGHSPLIVAAKKGHVEIARLLINAGAKIDEKVMATPLAIAANYGHVDMVELLIKHGAKIDDHETTLSRTPLHNAVHRGHKAVVELLLKCGADIEAKDCRDNTALSIACTMGHIEVVTALLEHGANPNHASKDGGTPLQNICAMGNIALLKLILKPQYKLDVNAQGTNGVTPLMAALTTAPKPYLLAQMLIEAGADVNIAEEQYHATPLLLAIGRNDADLVTLLIKNGANVNHRLKNGVRILNFCKDSEIKKILIKAGAKK